MFDPRNLVVLIGLSGSGKSYVAKRLSEKYDYKVLRSDIIRKELFGLKPQQSAKASYGKGIYTEEATKKVYKTLIERAKELINRGEKVVLDATFLKRWQRELVLSNFPNALFVWVWAPEDVVIERLKKRKGDVSDADISVYLKQKVAFEIPQELLTTFVIQSDEVNKLAKILKL